MKATGGPLTSCAVPTWPSYDDADSDTIERHAAVLQAAQPRFNALTLADAAEPERTPFRECER